MMFRYYIFDYYNKEIRGTNKESIAESIRKSSDYLVLNAKENKWMHSYGEDFKVREWDI